jgi:hypothetical protein
MSDSDDQPPMSARQRRARRRKKAPAGRKLWIVLGVVGLLLVSGFFGVQIWLRSYLQSEKFRRWISAEASQRLEAEVEMSGITWQDSSATVGSFTAKGSVASAFGFVEARDIRATVNAGAVWDRVWQVDGVKVARVFVDLSAPKQAAAPAVPAAGDGSGSSGGSGFLSSFLPNRTVVKEISVDQAGMLWCSGENRAEVRGIGLQVKPAETNEFFLFSGHGGTVNLSMAPEMPVKLEDFEASWQDGELTVDALNADAAGAQLTAEGTVSMGDRAALDLKAGISGLDLSRVLPPDWLKSLSGKAGGTVRVSGDPRVPAKLLWRGQAVLREGLLEGLPLLHVIAKKTRNEALIRLLLKDARTDFTRTGEGGWLLEKIMVDAGTLRMKGRASTAPDGALNGDLLLGILPGTLRYLAGAEQSVFLPLNQLLVTQQERSLITQDDAGLLWTRLKLHGTVDHPKEDLSDRLAQAWFNATVDEVMGMSMEGAFKAAELASKTAAAAAGQVLEKAPEMLENGLKTGSELLEKGIEGGGGLLEKGVEGGLKAIDGLLPGGP